jgi:hypothetical protein
MNYLKKYRKILNFIKLRTKLIELFFLKHFKFEIVIYRIGFLSFYFVTVIHELPSINQQFLNLNFDRVFFHL